MQRTSCKKLFNDAIGKKDFFHVGNMKENQFKNSILCLIEGVARYVDACHKHWDQPIGRDYVLGPAVEEILFSIETLLNGPTGNIDCGHASSLINAIAKIAELNQPEA